MGSRKPTGGREPRREHDAGVCLRTNGSWKTNAGLIISAEELPIGQMIDELLTIAECASLEDFAFKVEYLPI